MQLVARSSSLLAQGGIRGARPYSSIEVLVAVIVVSVVVFGLIAWWGGRDRGPPPGG